MYAILFEQTTFKGVAIHKILHDTLLPRNDENLNRLRETAQEYRVLFPEAKYTVVKVEMSPV